MSDTRSPAVAAAYAHCRALSRHYENFPVGSVLFPRAVRDHVLAVYAFARAADDMADEGSLDPEARLQQLDAWERHLDGAESGTPDHPVFVALADTMHRLAIPAAPFHALLSAFRQDVTVTRYERFEDLRDYCARSANPVGEIVLRLFGVYDPVRGALSDAICTALQLANFWQDVAADYRKGRVYIPQEDLRAFGVTEAIIAHSDATPEFRRLMEFEADRTAALFGRGAALPGMLTGRLRVEIAWTLGSGKAVLDLLRKHDFDVFAKSNRLSALARVRILVRAIGAGRI